MLLEKTFKVCRKTVSSEITLQYLFVATQYTVINTEMGQGKHWFCKTQQGALSL